MLCDARVFALPLKLPIIPGRVVFLFVRKPRDAGKVVWGRLSKLRHSALPQSHAIQYGSKAFTLRYGRLPESFEEVTHLNCLVINGCGLDKAQWQGAAAVPQQRETQPQHPSRSLCLPTPYPPASKRHSYYLRFFDFQKGIWKQTLPLNPHIQADYGSRWVILEGGTVFVCGSFWSTAYVLGEGVEQVKSSMQGYRVFLCTVCVCS